MVLRMCHSLPSLDTIRLGRPDRGGHFECGANCKLDSKAGHERCFEWLALGTNLLLDRVANLPAGRRMLVWVTRTGRRQAAPCSGWTNLGQAVLALVRNAVLRVSLSRFRRVVLSVFHFCNLRRLEELPPD